MTPTTLLHTRRVLAVALALLSLGACAQAPARTPRLQNGMAYSAARRAILDAGWHAPETASHGRDTAGWNRIFMLVSRDGYTELVGCSGTGRALCSFEFTDDVGRRLIVVTAGEQDDPTLDLWRVKDAPYELDADQRAALDLVLKRNPSLAPLTEDQFGIGEGGGPDPTVLTWIRSDLSSPDLHPYVTSGDFNGDGWPDFAVMLEDTTPLGYDPGPGLAMHVVVIFDGTADGYVVGGTERTAQGQQSFFYPLPDGPVTVVGWESEECYRFAPTQSEYRAEPCADGYE